MSHIRYYITGHGLGHASRSCQIIGRLRQRHPELKVEVVSTAHSWFLRHYLDPDIPVRPLALDFGVLQHDSLVMREAETLQAYREFLPLRQQLVLSEAQSLRTTGVHLVAADIPAAAFAAARLAGVYAVGISNFTWDWIYQGLAQQHPGYDDVLQSLSDDYRQADLLLRLPFHVAESNIARVEDQPLVARISDVAKGEIRRRLQLPDQGRIGLISFGGFGLKAFNFTALGQLDDWLFLTDQLPPTAPPNLRSLPTTACHYADLVRAADVVITKPGYGIVAECLANDTACLYTGRGDFREQALLIEGLHRYGRALEISNDDLRSGNWREALEALLRIPPARETLPSHGDTVIADRLAQLTRARCGTRP